VLLSTPLHASSNFTPFAECICTACKQKGIKKISNGNSTVVVVVAAAVVVAVLGVVAA
jgi:hypothetical protein